MPGHNLSKKRQGAKARLLDFQIVRDFDSGLLGKRQYELLLWLPSDGSVDYSEKMIVLPRNWRDLATSMI